jgi:hypothetical protein
MRSIAVSPIADCVLYYKRPLFLAIRHDSHAQELFSCPFLCLHFFTPLL